MGGTDEYDLYKRNDKQGRIDERCGQVAFRHAAEYLHLRNAADRIKGRGSLDSAGRVVDFLTLIEGLMLPRKSLAVSGK